MSINWDERKARLCPACGKDSRYAEVQYGAVLETEILSAETDVPGSFIFGGEKTHYGDRTEFICLTCRVVVRRADGTPIDDIMEFYNWMVGAQ